VRNLLLAYFLSFIVINTGINPGVNEKSGQNETVSTVFQWICNILSFGIVDVGVQSF